ncbi:MAG TPA: acyl-CoA dehydrogenase family protein [Dermatophilaceae bacterium]|nr:acyl-CoA dehydrogenase family protein [Dermatophilaceae bacterium]
MNTELRLLREMVRNFLETESVPNQEKWATQGYIDRDFWTKAGELGLLGVNVPEEYGGGGGTFAEEVVVTEECARIADDAWLYSVHTTIMLPYILKFGTEDQKRKWLPKLCSGEFVGAIGMTEPDAGSDLQAIRTKAVKDGDEYVINGTKTMISNGTHCSLVLLVAKTSDAPGAKGISLIVVENDDLPGFERGRELQKIGLKGQDTRELIFTDCRVPAANVLGGEEGQGFIQLMIQLPTERLAVAITAVASAETAVELATKYAKEREAFGKPLLALQNTRFVLAECKTEAFAARTFLDYLVQRELDGKLTAAEGSMAKYFCSDMQCRVIDRCLQIFGGYGYILEYPIARMYASARVQKIYAGSNEIMKELVARSL